jgi:hypothetical protein
VECEDFKEAATPPCEFHHRSYVFSLDVEEVKHIDMATWEMGDFEKPMFENIDMLAASDDEEMSQVI